MPLPEVTLYTDGACSPNPGTGGWGVVVLSRGKMQNEISGREEETTNNRMELTAALRGLESLQDSYTVTLVTDSTYVKNGITSWIHGWQQRGWLTADNQPVKNRDLWEQLSREIKRHKVDWQWVKGHALDPWNERADILAVEARGGVEGGLSESHAPRRDPGRIEIFSGITYAPSRTVGSWAIILCFEQYIKVLGDTRSGTSANEFHLLSTLAGLSALKRSLPVTLYTTSGYLRDGVTRWLCGWQQRHWLTSEGKEVSNKKLWQQLVPLLNRYEVEIQVVSRKDGFCLMQEVKELAREWQGQQKPVKKTS